MSQKIFKFWWDEELDNLKAASINSHRLWKAVGCPRSGSIFNERNSCRMQYRRSIREHERAAEETYTNELHEALSHKDGPTFWKCWQSKFNTRPKCVQIDGCVDHSIIANNFAQHFAKVCNT